MFAEDKPRLYDPNTGPQALQGSGWIRRFLFRVLCFNSAVFLTPTHTLMTVFISLGWSDLIPAAGNASFALPLSTLIKVRGSRV